MATEFGEYGGAVIGAGGGLIGSAMAARSAKKAATVQFKRSLKMRRTAYQATMKDMRKAGLNPMLAYSQGPTRGGTVSMARIPDFGQSITAGLRAGAEVSAKAVQKGLFRNQTELAGAHTAKTQAEAALLRYNIPYARAAAEYYTKHPEAVTAKELTGGVGGVLGPAFRALGGMWNMLPDSRGPEKTEVPYAPGKAPGTKSTYKTKRNLPYKVQRGY